jgi:hypothetical protein
MTATGHHANMFILNAIITIPGLLSTINIFKKEDKVYHGYNVVSFSAE